MNKERLEEIKEALDATTEGKWRYGLLGNGGDDDEPWMQYGIDIHIEDPNNPVFGTIQLALLDSVDEEGTDERNAMFIVDAHNEFVPELIAEVERLQNILYGLNEAWSNHETRTIG